MTKIKHITTIYDNYGYELKEYKCLNCHKDIYLNDESNYCSACGEKIEWNDNK